MGLGVILKKSLEFLSLFSTADNYFKRNKFSDGFRILEANAKEKTSALVGNENLIKNKYGQNIVGQLLVLFDLRGQLYSGLSKVSLYFEAQNYDAMNDEIQEIGKIFDEIHDGFVNLEREMRTLSREKGKLPAPQTYQENEIDQVTIRGSAQYILILKDEIMSIPENIQDQDTQHGKNLVFINKTILVKNFVNNKILSDLAELKTAI